MIHYANKGQNSYGHIIGILLLDWFSPHIPGDVANASTYDYPVLFELVSGCTFDKLLNRDRSVFEVIKAAAEKLQNSGARAITADCGFFAMFQNELAECMGVPVLMSSLIQAPMIQAMIGKQNKLGIISAVGENIKDEALLANLGIDYNRLAIAGMEDTTYFPDFGIYEKGVLDEDKVRQEIVGKAQGLAQDKTVKALLLECSMMAPYSAAVQSATGLPVFDFITLIDYVKSAVCQKEYSGYM